MSNRKKILAVIVNYGEEQLGYLEQVIEQFNSFKNYNVEVVVHTNMSIKDKVGGHYNEFVIELEDYQLLPMTCRQTIAQYKDEYDYFLFTENDHLWLEHHVDRFIEYNSIIPEDRITGLIQYEKDETGRYYPALHAHYGWDPNSVEEYNGKKFAHFNNVHQACFIITQEQLNKIASEKDFTQFFSNDHYSVKCKTNTDIYQYCGMKKLICISDFEANLIHHLPNHYINGADGYINADGSIGRRAKQRGTESEMQHYLKHLLN